MGSRLQLLGEMRKHQQFHKMKHKYKEMRREKQKILQEMKKLKKENVEFEKQKEELKRLVKKEHETGAELAKEQEKVTVQRYAKKTGIPLKQATGEVRTNAFQKQVGRAGLLRRQTSIHNLARGIAMHRINPIEARQRIAHLSPKERKILESDYARVMDQHIGRRIGARMALSGEEQKYLERAEKSKTNMAAIRWTAEIETLAEKVAFRGFHKLNKHEASVYNAIMASPSSKKMFKERYNQLIETF